jgi:hypothetical protein
MFWQRNINVIPRIGKPDYWRTKHEVKSQLVEWHKICNWSWDVHNYLRRNMRCPKLVGLLIGLNQETCGRSYIIPYPSLQSVWLATSTRGCSIPPAASPNSIIHSYLSLQSVYVWHHRSSPQNYGQLDHVCFQHHGMSASASSESRLEKHTVVESGKLIIHEAI